MYILYNALFALLPCEQKAKDEKALRVNLKHIYHTEKIVHKNGHNTWKSSCKYNMYIILHVIFWW